MDKLFTLTGGNIIEVLKGSAGLVASISAFFWGTEKFLSQDAKDALAKWLLRVDVKGGLSRWPFYFIMIFDRVFGKDHFTWRCFYRSSIASLIAIIFFLLFWAMKRPNQFDSFVSEIWHPDFYMFLILCVVMNVIPDYLSLVETRYIIKKIDVANRWYHTITFLLLDIFISMSIFMIVGIFLLSVANIILIFIRFPDLTEINVNDMVRLFIGIFSDRFSNIFVYGIRLDREMKGISLGVFFYSTFLTSFWVWLYILACAAARSATHFSVIAEKLRWLLDVKNHPVAVPGTFAAIITVFFYWIYLVIVKSF
jgi:hypothetical protein